MNKIQTIKDDLQSKQIIEFSSCLTKYFKMKIIVAFLLVVAALYVDGACVEKYTTKYDSFDIDSVLSNRRLLESYVNCLLEKGKCTKEGVELKSK